MSESRSPHEDIVGSSEVDPEAIRRFKEATARAKTRAEAGPVATPEDVVKGREEATDEPEKTDTYYQDQLDRLREIKRQRENGELPDDDTQQ